MINLKQIFGLENKAPNIFARKIVSKMKKDDGFKLEMFAKWEQEKLSVGDVGLKLKVPYSKRNLELFLEYVNHVTPTKVSEVSRNRRVHFDDNVDIREFDTDEMLEWLRIFGR